MTRVAALTVALLGLAACPPCPPPEDEIFLVRTPDAVTQALVDRCEDPAVHDCLPLCAKVSGVNPSQIVHCEIHPRTEDGFVQVHVGIGGPCPPG